MKRQIQDNVNGAKQSGTYLQSSLKIRVTFKIHVSQLFCVVVYSYLKKHEISWLIVWSPNT